MADDLRLLTRKERSGLDSLIEQLEEQHQHPIWNDHPEVGKAFGAVLDRLAEIRRNGVIERE